MSYKPRKKRNKLFSFSISKQTKEKLEFLAKNQNMSLSQVIRTAIDYFYNVAKDFEEE